MNGEKPLVSVVVPVCNVERYLAQCLEALMAQTLENIEVIAIDDGSTDSSPAILAHYAALDSRIRVITKPNEGYGATVNRGVDEARADYVGIVESDDYPEPTMFEKLHRAAVRFDADLVKCDFFDTFEDGERPRGNLSALPHGVAFDPADHPEIVLVTPSIWAALYRRRMLVGEAIRCRITPGAAFQDTAFALQCLTTARRCVLIAPPLLHYRRDNPNASSQSADKLFAVADEFAYVRNRLARDPRRYDRFIGYMRVNEWRTHQWDSKRISPEARDEYFARVRNEFALAVKAGELDRALFTHAELEALRALLRGGADQEASGRRRSRTRSRRAAVDAVKVSIVVPAHDDEEFLGRALASCLGQTHRNIEVVCVDDASTDETLSVMRAHAQKDSRVKVARLARNMLTHTARLAGTRVATGDVLTFLDADDELDVTACERIAREYASDPFDILHFATRVESDGSVDAGQVDEMERWCRPPRGGLEGASILVRAFVEHAYSANLPAKAFRADLARAAFESIGFIEADHGEDLMEYFAIACRSSSYRTLRLPLYVYHLGDGLSARGAMTAADFGRPLRGIRALEGIGGFADRAGLLPELQGVIEVHRLEQLNVLLRTLNESVVPEDKGACLAELVDTWGTTLGSEWFWPF